MSKVKKGISDESEIENKLPRAPRAIVLENFNFQIPMPGHRTAYCIMAFREGQEITDPHVIKTLIGHKSILVE